MTDWDGNLGMRATGGPAIHGDNNIQIVDSYVNNSPIGNSGASYGEARRWDPPRRTVLLLMSNPIDTQPLRLDEEYRAIDLAIIKARHRDRIELRSGFAPRFDDLQDLLLRHRPAVVHFAGHSSRDGIALVDDYGQTHTVRPHALRELFAVLNASIRCVVLNACLTADQASAISKHVPCVVGMSRSVPDGIAIEFAAGFYGAVADGQSVAQAFRLGRNRLALRGLDTEDPVLIDTLNSAENISITR